MFPALLGTTAAAREGSLPHLGPKHYWFEVFCIYVVEEWTQGNAKGDNAKQKGQGTEMGVRL